MARQQVKRKRTSKQDKEAEAVEDTQAKDTQESAVDLDAVDALLEEIDELLDEADIEEAARRAEYREKLRSIQFGGKSSQQDSGLTLVEEVVVVCSVRCANCTCGR